MSFSGHHQLTNNDGVASAPEIRVKTAINGQMFITYIHHDIT